MICEYIAVISDGFIEARIYSIPAAQNKLAGELMGGKCKK